MSMKDSMTVSLDSGHSPTLYLPHKYITSAPNSEYKVTNKSVNEKKAKGAAYKMQPIAKNELKADSIKRRTRMVRPNNLASYNSTIEKQKLDKINKQLNEKNEGDKSGRNLLVEDPLLMYTDASVAEETTDKPQRIDSQTGPNEK